MQRVLHALHGAAHHPVDHQGRQNGQQQDGHAQDGEDAAALPHQIVHGGEGDKKVQLQIIPAYLLADVIVPAQPPGGGALDIGAGGPGPVQQQLQILAQSEQQLPVLTGQRQAGARIEVDQIRRVHHGLHVDLHDELAQQIQIGDVFVVQQEIEGAGGRSGHAEQRFHGGEPRSGGIDLLHALLLLGIGSRGGIQGELPVLPEQIDAVQPALVPGGLVGGHAAHHAQQGIPPVHSQV